MKIGKALDFLKSQALNFVFQNLGGDPSTPAVGQAWFDTAANRLKIRHNTAVYDPTDRATHSGTQPASSIDATFETRAQAIAISAFQKAAADIDFNSFKGINVAPPVALTDLARLADVQNYKSGTVMKDPVRVQAAANVTIASPGATHDGVTLANGDRILLAVNQTAGAERGIYQYNGAAVPLTRTADAVQGTLVSGTIVPVLEGTTYADTAWRLNSPDGAITVGTTATTWGEFARPFVPVAGSGITVSGSTISAAITSVFTRTGAIVATLGDYTDALIRITSNSAEGIWPAVNASTTLGSVLSSISTAINARALSSRAINTAVGSGLSGGGNLTADRSLTADVKTVFTRTGNIVGVLGDYAASLVTNDATGVTGATVKDALQNLNTAISSAAAPKRYSETLATSAATYTVTHALGTQDLVASVREVATNEVVLADVAFPTVNTATVAFATAAPANAYRVSFIG